MATELAALGLSATSEDLLKAVAALDKLTEAAYDAGSAAEGLEDKADGANRATRAEGKSADESAKAHDRLSRSTDSVNGSLHSMASRLGTVAGSLVAMAATYFGASALAKAADGWSDMSSRIGAATKDMEAAPMMMQRMVDLANASYSPLDQTVEVYSRNVAVLRDLGIEAAGAADFTESLNHMLVITATKGERAASVQNALSKAMAVGKLGSEELETVMASGGRVAEALAKQLGTNVSNLRNLASEGRITGQVISQALLGSLEDVREEAGKMDATMGDGLIRISTGFTALVGTLDQYLGVSGGVAQSLVWIGDLLASLASTDYGAWATSLADGAVLLGQVLLVLAATRLPALLASIMAINVGSAIMTAQFIAGAVASRGMAAALGAMELGSRGLAGALAMVGGPIGIIVAGVAAMGLAIWNTHGKYSAWKDATLGVESAQVKLNEALDAFDKVRNANTIQGYMEALKTTVDGMETEVATLQARLNDQKGWETLLTFGFGHSGSDAIQTLLTEAQNKLMSTRSELDAMQVAWLAVTNQTAEAKAGIVALTTEQQRAIDSSNELTLSYQNRAELARTENQYGRDSTQYLQTQLNQERQIQFAKIAALDITNQQKSAVRAAYDLMVITEAKTQGWTVTLGEANGKLSTVYQYLVKISQTQPGSGWLSMAISRAATLATTLWDAVAANSSLSIAGPAVSDERGSQRAVVHEATGYVRDNPLKPTNGGAGGGGGSLEDPLKTDLQTLQESLMSQTELQQAEWVKQQEILAAALDQKLVTKITYDQLIQEAEAAHQAKMRELGDYGNQQGLANAASFFEGMASLTASGGSKVLALSRGFAAAQGIINSYLAFTEVLRDPSYVGRPWARFAAAAGALAQGLAAVRSIKSSSTSGTSGGGSAPAAGVANSSSQSGAAETPLRVTLDAIDPNAAYTGAAMIKMFEAIQKEAGNRGIQWVAAGA